MIIGEKKMKIQEYQKIKNEEISELKEAIYQIAEIIRMEMPLRYQDRWLASMVERGLYRVEDEVPYVPPKRTEE